VQHVRLSGHRQQQHLQQQELVLVDKAMRLAVPCNSSSSMCLQSRWEAPKLAAAAAAAASVVLLLPVLQQGLGSLT
jgi:hypothetical protein